MFYILFYSDLGETGLSGAAAGHGGCQGERGHGDLLRDGTQNWSCPRICASAEYLQQPGNCRVWNVAGTPQTDHQEGSYT